MGELLLLGLDRTIRCLTIDRHVSDLLTKQRHGPVLLALVELLGYPRGPDQEDALMDTILRVLEREVEGDVVGADLKSVLARRYAVRALQNQLITQWRARRRLEPLRADVSHTPEAAYELGELEKALLIELQRELPQADQALLGAYLNGKETFRTEFERQGISPGNARVRVHRVLKRLRERGRGLAPIRQ